MERFQEELSEAKQCLRTADHVASVTYPLVKDNRLLLTVMENLFRAGSCAMASLLHYDELFKRLPKVGEDYSSRIRLFKLECVPRYSLGRDCCVVMDELKSLHDDHEASAVEFSRKDCIVVCSDRYSFRRVTAAMLKSYIGVVKLMLSEVEGVVASYEGIFGRSPGRVKAR